MSFQDDLLWAADAHPLDMVELLASRHRWEIDRVADDQAAMAVEGQWRTYSLTLAWSEQDETLRLICTFEMEPPAGAEAAVYALLNQVNDECWLGAFSWWQEQRLMVWRHGLSLAGGQVATVEQLEVMVRAALAGCERFYPAFQLVAWGGQTPGDAMGIALAEPWGRA